MGTHISPWRSTSHPTGDPELGQEKEEKEGGAKHNGGDPQHPGRGAPEADRPRAEPARGGEPDKGRTGRGGSKCPLAKAVQP